jgi:AraC-like DNA-binding protein
MPDTPAWWGREHTRVPELHHLGRHRILRSTVIAPHRLPCTEIGLVVSGELTVRVADGTVLTAVGGQAIVIPPDTEFASAGSPVRGLLYWIGLDPLRRASPAWNPVLLPDEAASLARAEAPWHLRSLPMRAATEPADHLATLLADPASPLLARRAAVLALLWAVQSCFDRPVDGASPARVQVAAAIAAIDGDPGKDHQPDGLARLCGMGRTSFNSAFRSATGFTPRDYLTRRRLDRACDLLRAGRTVQQAARAVGFSSGQYLATAFKRVFSTTPSGWLAIQGGT